MTEDTLKAMACARCGNLTLELDNLLKDLIDQTMNEEMANTVKMKVEITKVEDK